MMNFRNDKRGVVGSFMVMFVATVAIVLILFLFIFGSGLIKRIHKVDADVSIHDEKRTGLSDVLNYILEYEQFAEAKFLIEGGTEIDDALVEVEYEK